VEASSNNPADVAKPDHLSVSFGSGDVQARECGGDRLRDDNRDEQDSRCQEIHAPSALKVDGQVIQKTIEHDSNQEVLCKHRCQCRVIEKSYLFLSATWMVVVGLHLGDIQGNIGNFAVFHSWRTNRVMKIEPKVSMAITIGSEALNCVPMPETGINSKIDPAELNAAPNQSIFLSFVESGSGGIV
jgi:hypothetical protein